MAEFYVAKIENDIVVAFGIWQESEANRKRLAILKEEGYIEVFDKYVEGYDGKLYKENETPDLPVEAYNEKIRQIRENRFREEADPIKHNYEEAFARGETEKAEILKKEWLDKKDEIRLALPYKE